MSGLRLSCVSSSSTHLILGIGLEQPIEISYRYERISSDEVRAFLYLVVILV